MPRDTRNDSEVSCNVVEHATPKHEQGVDQS